MHTAEKAKPAAAHGHVSRKAVTHLAGKAAWKIVHAVVTFGICFMILLPLLQKFVSMFMSSADIVDVTVAYLPKQPTTRFLKLCFEVMNYPTTLLYSLATSFGVAFIQTMVCSFVAYGFARFRFPLRKVLFALTLFTMVVPPSVLLIPQYVGFQDFNPLGIIGLFTADGKGINLLGTWWPTILSSLTGVGFRNALFIYLLRQFYMGFPKALEEAAMIDGVRTVPIYFRIAMPAAFSMMTTCFLFSFVWQYTDMYYTTYYMPNVNTISRQLSGLITNVTPYLVNIKELAGNTSRMPTGFEGVITSTGIILAVVPLVLIYLVAQRFFTESIENTGIK